MKTLLVLLGPTGVGKTELSLQIAGKINSPIISADSRQIYKDLIIGTAAPNPKQIAVIKHYMVGLLALDDYYSASQFETDVIMLLENLYVNHHTVVMTGGSMLYINAICNGIDEMPTVTPEIREALWQQYENEGLDLILEELRIKDPAHYNEVDRNNYKRVIHAVEVCRMTNQPYSSFRTNCKKDRPFRIVKIGLNRPREELYDRINKRVDDMVNNGLLDEARNLYTYRRLNSLNTVGYKELFEYFDGKWSLEFAIEKIKRNSRVYARKQLTWFKRDQEIHWFHPEETDYIFNLIRKLNVDLNY